MSPSPAKATENDALLKRSNLRTSERSTLEEFGSLALTVVEDSITHEPVVLHDLTGPVMLMDDDPDLLERRDSLYSVVSNTAKVSDLQSENDSGGQATISSEIAIMAKNLIGCGSLSLCNGIALCANAPSAIWAGNFWILILGAIFGYFCWLIAKVCNITGRTTYRGIWQETVGSRGSMAVSIVNGLKAGLANLAYTCILADTTLSLFLSAGYNVPRGVCLLIVTFCFILPLCLLKNLHVLAPFSVLGTAGIVFTAGAMLIRYKDGSYEPGGKYFDDIDSSLQPMFGTVNNAWSADILPFVCMAYEVSNFASLGIAEHECVVCILMLFVLTGIRDALQCGTFLYRAERQEFATIWGSSFTVFWFDSTPVCGNREHWISYVWRQLCRLHSK
jgi:hypothetical protein